MGLSRVQELLLSLVVLFLLCYGFFRFGDDHALQENIEETYKVGTIKMVDDFDSGAFEYKSSDHPLEWKYPSLPHRSELWYYAPGDEEGVKVEVHEDAVKFGFQWVSRSPKPKTREAYVTLLGSNDHILGARVLGKSVRLANSKKDLVALVTNMVSDANLGLLIEDGWRVAVIPFIENPFIEPEDPKHLNYEERHEIGRRKTVLCKLHIWNLVEYDSIFYLDTDIIVVPGLSMVKGSCDDEPPVEIDTIFNCGKNESNPDTKSKIGQFCAFQYNYDWSPSPAWFFNAGVMLIKPSRDIFRDILEHARWLGTNRNFGDQGTLQKYFFLTCISEGRFLLRENPDEIAKLRCQFPDADYLEYSSTQKVNQFRELCKSIGTELSEEQYMLLPPLFHTSGPKANLYINDELRPERRFKKTHMWTQENLGDNIQKVYEANFSGCMQLDRPWQDWASDDMHGDDRCESGIIHYLDPDRKPWHWRLWPLAGYYSEWRKVSNMLPSAWRDVYFQVFVWSTFPVLILLAWTFFLNTWFCGIRNIEFESCRVFFYLGACLRSVEFPVLGHLCKLFYHPKLPIIFKLPFYLIPTPLDPLLANWERISLFVLMPCSVLGTALSFQIVPNQLPPLTGWLIFAEWSSFICCTVVITWAYLVYRVAHREPYGQNECFSLNRWLQGEPMDRHTKLMLFEGLKLFLLQMLLEILLLAVLMYYGRFKNYDWWDLHHHRDDFFKARVVLSWPVNSLSSRVHTF